MGKGPRSSDTITESDIGRNITRSMKRVRFRSCGTVGYGPTKNREGGDMLCDHDARLSENNLSAMSATMSVPGAVDIENHLLLVNTRRTNWQSSCPGGHRDFINNGNKGY